MLRGRLTRLIAALALLVMMAAPTVANARAHAATDGGIPLYRHIFLIVLENHNYDKQIIGNPYAPHINHLAQTYGLATHYYGITHPSEPNYVAMIGGNYFGIQDDAAYTSTAGGVDHTIDQPSLAEQLTAAGLTWKAYQQSLPYPGYLGTAYPVDDPLYASKHNPFLNFASVQHESRAALRREIVPVGRLAADLRHDSVPSFSFITPDLCHDMHGGASECPYANNANDPNDPNNNKLVQTGDNYVQHLVRLIMRSTTWTEGNNAIVITWDENDNFDNPNSPDSYSGCCDANPGGGHVVTIVIGNHVNYGSGGITDSAPYNHYALLRTIQAAFGLGCLQHTCDTANVPLMTPLFAVGGQGGPGPTPTPELGSGELLATGLATFLAAAALYRRRRSRTVRKTGHPIA